MKKNISRIKSEKGKALIHQAKNGAIELRGDFSRETIWAMQAQIAEVFEVERFVVTKHIRNILKDKELDEKSVCANFAHIANDGKTYQVQFYNLDIAPSVGYRVNSAKAIVFRRWATGVLRQHIVDGYTINRNRIGVNHDQFLKAVDEIKHFLPNAVLSDAVNVVELVRIFDSTWLSLESYDKSCPQGIYCI